MRFRLSLTHAARTLMHTQMCVRARATVSVCACVRARARVCVYVCARAHGTHTHTR
jgi:hypothetical protein